MKRCPTCNQAYLDDAVIFCTNDGTTLVSVASSSSELQPTMLAPPPSVTDPPPTSFSDDAASANWNMPPSHSPPQAWNAPGGWPQQQPGMPPGIAQVRGKQQALAITSLIFGVLSITFGIICGGPVFGAIAVVLGIIALLQIRSNPERYGGKGFAIVGIITGSLWILFLLFMLVIAIIGNLAN